MKTLKKITVWITTLAVGIGLLVGSMGVASASPHYSDWSSPKGNFKAPATSPAFGNKIDTKFTNGDTVDYQLKNVILTSVFTDGDTVDIKLMWREDGTNRVLLVPVPRVI